MTFTSFAQNFEDVMLWRALKSVRNGFYIDVGAHDPTYGSVTKAFYDRGWCGINIEPIPTPFGLLQAARPRDINLQICAGAVNGEINIYDVLPSGLATAQWGIAEEYRAAGHSVTMRHVPIKTLDDICKEHVKGEIHFLKIDVEGFEKEVLLGANFSKFRPWLLVIEATYPNSPEVNYLDWENIVLGAGYRFAYFDGLNRFYVAFEHADLLSCFNTPPNFFDGFTLSSTCFFARPVTAELEEAGAPTRQAEARARQAEARARQAEARARQAEARARQAEARIQAFLSSTSWRITAPVRSFSVFIANIISLSGRISNTVWRMSKHIFRRNITKLVHLFLLRFPSLTYVISKLLLRFPALRQKLLYIMRRYGGLPATTHHTTKRRVAPPSTMADLKPRARQIYTDIKAVIENRPLSEGAVYEEPSATVLLSKTSIQKKEEV